MPAPLPPIPVRDWESHLEGQHQQATVRQDQEIASLGALEQEDQQRQQAREQAWQQRTAQEDAAIAAHAQAEQQAAAQPEQDFQQRAQREDQQIAAYAQQEQQGAGAGSAMSRPPSASMPGGTEPVPPGQRTTHSPGVEANRASVEAAFGDLGPGVVENMLAIQDKESGGNPAAVKTDAIEDSHGPLQVNARAHPDLAAKYDLHDPAQNARAAREVYDAQGYAAWLNASRQLGLVDDNGAPTSPGGRGGPSTVPTADSSVLGSPPTPAQESRDFGGARGPNRAEAVGQFEQGLPYEEAAAICGPVAALAFAQANGRNPSLAEVTALAKRRGWTSTGGMNGIANEQSTLSDIGVESRLDTDPDFGEIAHDAASGNPVIISTGVHYYYANAYDPRTGRLFVGKTGTSRRGGGSWMTAQQIADLDGGINGVLYVDNPQSPTPSVAASSGDSGGERPPSEFEPPSAFPPAPERIVPTLDRPITPADVGREPAPQLRPEIRRISGLEGTPSPLDIPALVDVPNRVGFQTAEAIATGRDPGAALLEMGAAGGRQARGADLLAAVGVSAGPARDEAGKIVDAALDYTNAIPGLTLTRKTGLVRQLVAEPLGAVVGSEVAGKVGEMVGGDTGRAVGELAGGLVGAGLAGERYARIAGDPRTQRLGITAGGGDESATARRLQDAVDARAGGEVERLRLDKFPEEARDTIARAAERGDFWTRQRRNVVTDAEAERMADELGKSVEEMVAGGKAGRAYNTEETRALRNGVVGQALKVDDLKATVEALGDRASDALRRELGEEEARLLALSRVVEGARAEAGRTFRAYLMDTRSRLLRSREPEYTAVSRVPTTPAPELGPGVRQATAIDPHDFYRGPTDPGRAAGPLGTGENVRVPAAARQGVIPGAADLPTTGRATNLLGQTTDVGVPRPSLYDRFQTVRFAGMLSSTATQILNNTANAVNTLADVGLKPLQVALDAAVSKTTGAERTRYLAEVAPQTKALVAGMLTGAKKIPHIMRTGVDPETAAALDLPQRSGLRSGSRTVDAVVEAPLRALSAADAMWRGGAEAGHAAALATRQAIREGLSGAARSARVDYVLSNMHEFPRLAEEAKTLAARSVFQERRGEIDPAIALLKGTRARYVTDVVLPFVRTPYNVAAQGAGMTPAGFASVWSAAKAGNRGEAVDRAVRAGVGTAAMGYGLSLAAGGFLTPAYPDDAAERSTLPDGWKPYSLRIPVEDGAVYVPLQMLGPVAMPLGIAAALGDLYKRGQAGADPTKLAYRSITALGKYVGDQAFLQGLAAIPNIIDEPERYLEQFVEGYASSLMPASALQKQVDQFLGHAPRDPHGALEGFLAASPLTSGLVRPRTTALGEERGTVAGPAAILAGTRITAERDDPTLASLRRIGAGVPADPKEIDGVPLTDAERTAFRALAGERIRTAVARVEGNPRVAALPAATRRAIHESAVEGAREQARGLLLKQIGAAEFARRRALVAPGAR